MRNIPLFITLVMVGIAIIFSGCSTFHEPTTTTTTTTLPARTFIGISLGDSTAEVISVLGQPESIYYEYDNLVYDYDSVKRAALFELPTEEVVAVVSANSNDELNSIRPGLVAAQVQHLLGAPDRVKTGSIFYMWLYDRYNIMVSFYIDDDVCFGLALYWPGKIDFDPD